MFAIISYSLLIISSLGVINYMLQFIELYNEDNKYLNDIFQFKKKCFEKWYLLRIQKGRRSLLYLLIFSALFLGSSIFILD